MQDKAIQIIRFPALRKKLGDISRSTVDRWESQKCFPKRIHLGKNSVGWSLEAVENWLQKRSSTEQEKPYA